MKELISIFSEKKVLPDGQMSLFGEETNQLIELELAGKVIRIKEHKRPIRKKGDRLYT